MLAGKLALLAMIFATAATSQCRDENGATVSWFVALREPNSRRYQFFDHKSSKFRTLGDETFLKYLFQNVNVQKDQLILWNDEPAAVSGQTISAPVKDTTSTAHDKGVLFRGAGDRQGFFLLHSVPKFPEVSNGVLNPVTPVSSSYGQSMICISTSSDSTYQSIWSHLKAQNAIIYFNSFFFPVPPKTTVQVADSFIEGSFFRLVTKTILNLNPPFEGVLAPLFKTGWLVESWGRPYAANTYSPYRVINNEAVNFPAASYKDTMDHSKYALAFDCRGLLCIGGMNHMDSQASRGGSFVCFTHPGLYDQFWNVIMTPPKQLKPKKVRQLLMNP